MRQSLARTPTPAHPAAVSTGPAPAVLAETGSAALPRHSLANLAILPPRPNAPAQGAPIQLGATKQGKKKRQDQRRKQMAPLKKAVWERGVTGADYVYDRKGRVRRARPGKATANLYNAARTIRPRSQDLPVGFGTRAERAGTVLSLSSSFVADRGQGVDVTLSDGSEVGGLVKSNAPWFRIPDDAYSEPGEPSAFATPKTADGRKLGTTYKKDEGVFSGASFTAVTERAHAQRTLISAAESVRGAGAGLAQVVAEDVRADSGIAKRDKMYGTERGPGYLPAGYCGSQADIVLTDDHARDRNYDDLLENPTGFQTERVLADERQRRIGGLARSQSFPDLFASDDDHARDTAAVFESLGLPLEDDDLDTGRRLKRGRSLL